MSGRKIQPVIDNRDKQRTYRIHKGKYKRAMENGFYFEALLIDYALLEDRLRALLYHMGFLVERTDKKIWKKKSAWLREVVATYGEGKENDKLGISNISGKVKIVRYVLEWVLNTEGDYWQDRYLSTLKTQCEAMDIDAVLSTLDEIKNWCNYRNEVVHGLMNKNLESLSSGIEAKAEEGMHLANSLDGQVRLLKKGNKVRRSTNLKVN